MTGHVSGHGNKECIKQVIDITKPEIVIPIHGTQPKKIEELTDKALVLNDMETLEINQKGDYKIIMNKNIELEHEELHLPEDELIVIGARQGHNLSTIGLQIADNISRQNKPVAIFDMETSKQTLLEKLENTDNIYIDDTPNITLDYIEDQCQHLIQEHNIKLVIINHLQLIHDHQNILVRLRKYAEDNNITIILLSQQLKVLSINKDKPILEDIKDKTLRDLIDSLVFIYEEDINKVEQVKVYNVTNNTNKQGGGNMQDTSVITREQVMNKLAHTKLEDYTRDDLLDRYIVYGTQQELQDPTIQRALINNDFHIDLLDMVDIITDKQAIQDLLNSNIFEDKKILTMEGNISAIQFACESESNFKKDNDMICHTIVNFKDADGTEHKLYGHTFNNLQDMGTHRETLEPYYNNIVLVVESSDDKLYAMGFLKKYEDLDYKMKK